MSKDEILKSVRRAIVEEVGTSLCGSEENISLETHLKRDICVDSLDMCLIMVDLEENLKFKFSIEEQETIDKDPTVRNFVDIIYNKNLVS